MVVPQLQLCFELDYHDWSEFPSRGPAKLLLDDLKVFVEDRSTSESVESLSAAYLAATPAGLKHEPRRNDCQLAGMLSWPRDRLIITDLLSQLLVYVMEGHGPQTRIVDLTVDEIADREEAGVPVLSQPDQDETQSVISGLSELVSSQIAGPIKRLSLREPIMMAGLLAAGFTEPFPIAVTSREELINVLETWMECYSGENISSSNIKNHFIARKVSHVKELTFVSTSDRVWVEKFSINAHYNGWILKDDDGACMLVEPNIANSGAWRGYHGWCGADSGFTSLTIASTGPPPNRKIANGNEVDPKEADLGKASPPVSKKFTSQGTVDEGYDTDSLLGTRCSREASAQQVLVKKEPNRTAIRQATLRHNRLERQRSEGRWRSETPPLSSLATVKKPRWPPQYVSPPPTPKVQKHLRGGKKLPKASKSSISKSSRHKRCSRPGLTPVGPAIVEHEVTQLGNLDGKNVDKAKGRPRKEPRKKTADTPQMPISPVSPSSSPTVNRTMLEPVQKTNAILHFFLQKKELGALPTPLALCDTADKFFDHAEEAWGFLSSGDGTSAIAATSVEVEGVEWPMIIPWRDSLGYQWMMETIAKAATGRSYELHVQVKCITK